MGGHRSSQAGQVPGMPGASLPRLPQSWVFCLSQKDWGEGHGLLGGAMLKEGKTAAQQEEGVGVGTDGHGPYGALKFAHVFCTCEKEAGSPRLRGKTAARP